MRFGVLGPLAVWTFDGRPVRVPEVKVRALLADLLIHAGRVVPADRLIEDVWGESLPANPAGALQTRVSQLRRALEEAEPGSRELVVSRAPGYLLEAGADAVDAGRFRELAERARAASGPQAAALLADALSLWRGPVLSDFADEEFVRPEVARLEELRLTALEEQAEIRLELGEHGLLAGELGDLVARHPLRERLRGAQMRALYRAGRQSEALDSYRDLRGRLAEELGVDPGPELAALHQAILEQDPGLDAAAVRPAGAAAPPQQPLPRGNLPAPMGELIGRESAVTEVGELLDGSRLVTLTGPGGVGKTRLAVETARGLREAYPDGVWLVELAGTARPGPPGGGTGGTADPSGRAGRPAGVAEVVAAVLDIRDEAAGAGGGMPAAERLADALRGRQLLLVLDNCEHVIAPVAELAARLLRAAPELRILATSQEPLGVTGESLWAVPPLRLPAPDAGLGALREAGAVQLFVARAAAAAPGFVLDAGNAEVVEAICRRLDGIPLALELAATRVRALGVHELAVRLDDRFRLLSAGQRDAPARQRTLRAMIDWSWELLSPAEQAVLRRLAVHADGFALEAAEALGSGDGDDGAGGVAAEDVLDLLARLVDRSLVVVTAREGEPPRYRLLESVAAYCHERLCEAGEFDRTEQRYQRYYADLAVRAEPHLRGPALRPWLRRLDDETANLRDALEGAVRRGDTQLSLRLVNALAWYWVLRGRLGEGRRSMTLALSAAGPAREAGPAAESAAIWQTGFILRLGERPEPERLSPRPVRPDSIQELAGAARAEWFLAFARTGLGDLPDDDGLLGGALAVFRSIGDQWGEAAVLGTRARQALLRSDLTALKGYGEQSMALFGELGDRWGQMHGTFALGILAAITGDYAEGRRQHRDGLRMAEDLGLWTEVCDKLSSLGRIALLTGDFAEADELHERARKLSAEQGYTVGEEYAALGLALSARRQGRLDVAEFHLRAWLEWDRQLDSDIGLALILTELGFVAELRGDLGAARDLHLEGLTAARGTGDPRAVAFALEGLAGVQTATGEHVHAGRLLGKAAALRESVGAPLPPAERGDVDRIAAGAQAALGGGGFAAAFKRGGAAGLEEALAGLHA